MTRGEKSDVHAKSIVLYLRFNDDGKPPWIMSSTKAARRSFSSPEPLRLICNKPLVSRPRDQETTGSEDENGRRFDNLTHAQKGHAGKFHFRSALSSHFVVDA